MLPKKIKLARYLDVAEIVTNDIITDVLSDEVNKVAIAAFNEVEKEQCLRIKEFQSKRQINILRKAFNEWRKITLKSIRQKAAVLNFPPRPSDLSTMQQNKKLGWTQEECLKRHGTLSSMIKGRHELDLMVKSKEIEEAIIQSAILEPFPLLDWIKEVDINQAIRLHWKLLLSLPESDGSSAFHPFLQMLKRKFRKSMPDSEKENLLVCQNTEKYSICVRQVDIKDIDTSSSSVTKRKVLRGSSGIMFVYIDFLESAEKAKSRLDALINTRFKIPAIPLVVITNLEKSDAFSSLGLSRYGTSSSISYIDIVTVSSNIFDISQCVNLNKALQEIMRKMPDDPISILSIKPLPDFIGDFLTSNVFNEFYSNLKDRRSRDLLDRPPQDLISLYNSALDHLSDTVRDTTLQDISWPAYEFGIHQLTQDIPADWNESPYINKLVEVINKLKLPELVIYEADTWKNLVEQVLVYLDKIAVSHVDNYITASAIKRSLARCYRGFVNRCLSLWGGEESCPPVEALPWTDIVHSCISYRLETILSNDTVCYKQEMLDNFNVPTDWLAGLGWGGEHLTDTMQQVVNDTVNETIEKSLLDHDESLLNSELNNSLKLEQKESVRFEKMLENVLNEKYVHSQNECQSSTTPPLETMEKKDGAEERVDGSCDLQTSQFVPLISYVSPTLGRLVSPYQLLTRQEIPKTGMSPKYSRESKLSFNHGTPINLNKRKAESCSRSNKKSLLSRSLPLHSPESRPLRMDLDQKIDALKVGVQHDMEQDSRFEKLLQAAMM